MNPTTQEPKDGQKVLVDLGNYVDPAIWHAEYKQFQRYPNHASGDRSITYFYSGVIGWYPFPEPSNTLTLKSEGPEKFVPSVPDTLHLGAGTCGNPAAEVVKNQGCEDPPDWDTMTDQAMNI